MKTIKPGDAVLAYTSGAYGRLIQLGQAIRWRTHRKWHHAAIVVEVEASGQVWCVQMARRCERVKLQDIAPGRPLKIVPIPENVNAEEAVSYANRQIGTKYGVSTIFSIAFNILTPESIRIDFRHTGTLICSALVARSWEHGNWDCPTDPFQISPAQIDVFLGENGWELPKPSV